MMLLLFRSTHFVIKADKIFEKNSIEKKIVPVPREISSECGMSIEIKNLLLEKVSKLLKNNNIEFKIHTI